MEELSRQMARARTARVRVGILGKKANRKEQPAAAARALEEANRGGMFRRLLRAFKRNWRPEDMTNAAIGLVHEFGSTKRRIPARSWLRLPIITRLVPSFTAKTADFWRYMIERKGIVKTLKILGIQAENVVQEAFDTGGWGSWAPWSDSYARRRELEVRHKKHRIKFIGPLLFKLLVKTGQLRRAVTSQVVNT
jgi:hypothetical protein